ncbi:prolyl oligopeptidase family serine peptidase [Algoriphagus halophilus]|uniref:dienelactone hydrolase family protein n=1 Tax=Algoriphagus halophilus TaxID=226505 RepID=UPI00358E054B
MRQTFLLIILFFQLKLLTAQTSLLEIDLENGPYRVGFRHYTKSDSTRTYSRVFDYTNNKVPRPIPISIWYPVELQVTDLEPMKVLDYLEILKDEEEWEHLPNEQILNWFYYANTPSNQQHLNEQTTAYENIEPGKGKFPVIVYAPSFQASSIENFALCEFLASHGYVVLSSPSRGSETRWFSNHLAKEMETQARDVEFLLKEAGQFRQSDLDKIGLMGFSFGGLATMITQNRNEWIKAVVSLDGTERYQYELLSQSPFFAPQTLNVPYLHMAQKDIPEVVLKEDRIDPEVNTSFQLFDSLSHSVAYQLKFHDLTHSYFSTLGVLFADRDTRQDKTDLEIMDSYRLMANYTLNFLNASLKEDSLASSFLEHQASSSEETKSLISQKVKRPEEVPFSFQDFNDLASSQHYENLSELYESILTTHPSFEIPEGPLNTLGLQLVFNPATSNQGIKVFQLAVSLFPNSANLYDSLGEGYLFIGDKTKAMESFEKSLELNSQNQNAIHRLEQLRN